mgnify:CR=1 FL=1
MLGVVVWSDGKQKSAVIWCEDHGDLAFVDRDSGAAPSHPHLAPGDLVAFDLSAQNGIRLAVSPRVVAAHEYPFLAPALKTATSRQERGDRLQALPVPASRDRRDPRGVVLSVHDRHSGPPCGTGLADPTAPRARYG